MSKRKTRRRRNKKNSYYRSYFEERVAKQLKQHKADYEYEPYFIDYVLPRKYKPDFVLSNGIVIEVKGYFRPSDRQKLKAVKESNPDLDIRLLFEQDNWLSKKHSMRYSDWARKHGFKYAIGKVPKSWCKE